MLLQWFDFGLASELLCLSADPCGGSWRRAWRPPRRRRCPQDLPFGRCGSLVPGSPDFVAVPPLGLPCGGFWDRLRFLFIRPRAGEDEMPWHFRAGDDRPLRSPAGAFGGGCLAGGGGGFGGGRRTEGLPRRRRLAKDERLRRRLRLEEAVLLLPTLPLLQPRGRNTRLRDGGGGGGGGTCCGKGEVTAVHFGERRRGGGGGFGGGPGGGPDGGPRAVRTSRGRGRPRRGDSEFSCPAGRRRWIRAMTVEPTVSPPPPFVPVFFTSTRNPSSMTMAWWRKDSRLNALSTVMLNRLVFTKDSMRGSAAIGMTSVTCCHPWAALPARTKLTTVPSRKSMASTLSWRNAHTWPMPCSKSSLHSMARDPYSPFLDGCSPILPVYRLGPSSPLRAPLRDRLEERPDLDDEVDEEEPLREPPQELPRLRRRPRPRPPRFLRSLPLVGGVPLTAVPRSLSAAAISSRAAGGSGIADQPPCPNTCASAK